MGCIECDDSGYIVVPEHGCGGDERLCAEACPVPIQVACPRCGGATPEPATDKEPF